MSPDIAMCGNKTCPLKLACYRFVAEPNPFRQSYGHFQWDEDNEGEVTCDYYWPVDN